MNRCVFCGETHGLFPLTTSPGTDEETLRHVCGKCWDTVWELAKEAAKIVIKEQNDERASEIGDARRENKFGQGL